MRIVCFLTVAHFVCMFFNVTKYFIYNNEEIFISHLIFVGEMAPAPAHQAAAAHLALVWSGLGTEKRPQTAAKPRETTSLQCGPSMIWRSSRS